MDIRKLDREFQRLRETRSDAETAAALLESIQSDVEKGVEMLRVLGGGDDEYSIVASDVKASLEVLHQVRKLYRRKVAAAIRAESRVFGVLFHTDGITDDGYIAVDDIAEAVDTLDAVSEIDIQNEASEDEKKAMRSHTVRVLRALKDGSAGRSLTAVNDDSLLDENGYLSADALADVLDSVDTTGEDTEVSETYRTAVAYTPSSEPSPYLPDVDLNKKD